MAPPASEADAIPAGLRAQAEPGPFAVDARRLLLRDGTPVKQAGSPNQSAGNSRKYLIVHYTAGTTLDGAVSWFMKPAARASAHLVIARDGSVVQMVPFDRRAWHAGDSKWKQLNGMNAHSIGIELVNAGKLDQTPQGWETWSDHPIPDQDVVVATHRNEQQPAGWHRYTGPQIDALLNVAIALQDAFAFEDVLGHDDVSPGRKVDPGPLFPMQSIRARMLGRQ